MFLQLHTAIGRAGKEQACDGPDVPQTKDLREKNKRPSFRHQNII